MGILKIKHWALFLGLLLQLAVVSVAYGAAGRFQFVVGDVRVADVAGKERLARKGGEVNEGESILSGTSGSAQIVMVDGGILAVRPDTQMKIDQFKYSGKEDGSERSFFSIVKGGFRSITGAIGKTHKENYGIKTPAATIGIRGTDSETVHVVVPLPAVPEGTYNKVNQGSTVMNGTAIAPNQVGYTPNLSTAAVILPAMPPIFEPPKPGQGPKKDQKGGSGNGEKSGEKKDQQKAGDSGKKNGETASTQNGQQQNGDSTAPSSTASPTNTATSSVVAAGSTTTVPVTNPIVTAGTVSSGGVAPTAQFIDAPIGSGGVGSEISFRTECVGAVSCTPVTGWWAGAGNMVREAGKTQTMLLNPATGMPVLLAEQGTADNFLYSAGTATVQGFGQDSVGGVKVSWGRYVGADTMVNDKGVSQDPLVMNMAWTDSALNFIQAQNYVSSLGGSPKTFSTYVGGSVTDELGGVYSITSGVLKITDLNNITLDIAASISGGRSWALHYGNGGEGLQQFYGGGCASSSPCGLGLLPTSTYTSGSTTNILGAGGKGEAHGVLIGSGGSATGALTSFSATVPGTAAISGAIVLK